MEDTRSLLLKKGWRRHTFISTDDPELETLLSALPEKLHPILHEKSTKIILTTYDCAVVHGSFDAEPWVQILIVTPTGFKKQFANGRDSRLIHFHVESQDGSIAYEARASGICQIDRELLTLLERDEYCYLSPKNAFDLKHWLSERFRQETWPDTFNNAIRPATKRLKALWKRYSNYITGLYIKLDTYNDITEGKYKASIIACVEAPKMRAFIQHIRDNDKSLADKDIEAVKNKAITEIRNAFGDCIEYETDPTTQCGLAIDVISEDSITLHQLREFPRFSPYNLSLHDGDSALPVEMLHGRTSE